MFFASGGESSVLGVKLELLCKDKKVGRGCARRVEFCVELVQTKTNTCTFIPN